MRNMLPLLPHKQQAKKTSDLIQTRHRLLSREGLLLAKPSKRDGHLGNVVHVLPRLRIFTARPNLDTHFFSFICSFTFHEFLVLLFDDQKHRRSCISLCIIRSRYSYTVGPQRRSAPACFSAYSSSSKDKEEIFPFVTQPTHSAVILASAS